jgi:cell wall-associated NlpC family hydrolase
MTRLGNRAALSAVLVIALLVLALTAAGMVRPDTAAAEPSRSGGKAAHTKKQRKAKGHVRKRIKRHLKKHRLSPGLRAVQIANRLTGIPYVWGGASPRRGFDCSGLVQYVYGRLGISLPHYTVSQYRRGRSVSRSSLRPGDLVFFHGLNHVGIYAGGGKYIHAPRAGSTVRWASLGSTRSYYGARRVVAA